MSTTILTILGTNYSGSHFVSLMLGSHSQSCHIGEVRHLRRDRKKGRRCDLCSDPCDCPILRGVTPETVDRVYEVILNNLREDGHSPRVLIDASKEVDWAHRFADRTDYQYRYLHLIRDPRALIRRWILTCKSWHERWRQRWKCRPLIFSRPAAVFGATWQVYLYRWLQQNRRITNYLERFRREHMVACYESLAVNPAEELAGVMSWLGMEYENGQEEYFRFSHHGTTKREYDWVKKKKQSGLIDLRWTEFLSPQVIRAVAANGDLRRYLSRVGVVMHDDGLRKSSG